jgi:mRNA interferase MazF
MVKKKYIPKYGDLVWVSFDPALGSEQKGRRPALVISSSKFNVATNLAYVCPITSIERDYMYRIPLINQKTFGFVMVDQLKSISCRDRKIEFIENVNEETLKIIVNLIEVVIEPVF